MDVRFAYLGQSRLETAGGRGVLSLAPNLARPAVAFDAPLAKPLRFREAVSALFDVVLSDLRPPPRDRTAYREWKRRAEGLPGEALRRALAARETPLPPGLEAQEHRLRRAYWGARRRYEGSLSLDLQTAIHIVHVAHLVHLSILILDPVITVAPDVLFLECFSADESSYGCLTVERDGGFGKADLERRGTTNVDYSADLYRHFQALRSYRETRLRLDPEGFDVATAGRPDYRERKVELPPSWLAGFLQIQAAMGLPMRRVPLSREAVYSVLAFLKRRRARTSPRAIRFDLQPGRPPRLVLEPWEKEIVSHGTVYQGPEGAPIRIWGRDRLRVLARVLSLAERFDVDLLGTGLPSFWTALMGEMRLTLGLSGWTANDWTRGAALDLLAPPVRPAPHVVDAAERLLREQGAARLSEVAAACGDGPLAAAALNHLAGTGQAIFDLHAKVCRWRPALGRGFGEAERGPDHPELEGARAILRGGRARVRGREAGQRGGLVLRGAVEGKEIEAVLDGDGILRGGKCSCSHHFKAGIRKGACRHILALRMAATRAADGAAAETAAAWYERLARWAGN